MLANYKYFMICDRRIHAGPILIQQVTEQQRRRQRGRDTVLYITTNLHNQTTQYVPVRCHRR